MRRFRCTLPISHRSPFKISPSLLSCVPKSERRTSYRCLLVRAQTAIIFSSCRHFVCSAFHVPSSLCRAFISHPEILIILIEHLCSVKNLVSRGTQLLNVLTKCSKSSTNSKWCVAHGPVPVVLVKCDKLILRVVKMISNQFVAISFTHFLTSHGPHVHKHLMAVWPFRASNIDGKIVLCDG